MDIEKIFNDAKNGDDYAISNLKKILQNGQVLPKTRHESPLL